LQWGTGQYVRCNNTFDSPLYGGLGGAAAAHGGFLYRSVSGGPPDNHACKKRHSRKQARYIAAFKYLQRKVDSQQCANPPPNVRRITMKLAQSLAAAALAALVAVPALSFAQSSQPVTRAEVKAELVQLQKAGYNASSDDTQYPANLQAALARVSAENGAAASSYGGVAQGATAAGSRSAAHAASNAGAVDQDVVGLGPIYAHS
jgi:hypothetical protein